jgi:uncharacterized membrane protein
VHRSLQIASPSDMTDALLAELERLEGVIMLSVRRGDSIKPPGDVIDVIALNEEADAVLAPISRFHGASTRPSVASASVDSLLDGARQVAINKDQDEALWEEADTAMRRHTRINLNFFLTTAVGAVIAACALSASSGVTEATALVAAAIITPAFEPLARLALSLSLGHVRSLRGSLSSLVGCYLTIVAAALLTMLVLRSGSHHFVGDVLRNSTFHEVSHPPAINLIISACGALAGVTMVAAGRYTVLAGPVVALQLLPASAAIGVALELGRFGDAAHDLGRLGIDAGMVLLAGVLVFSFKHARVHLRRRPLH